jgi:ankyrin repeat protein
MAAFACKKEKQMAEKKKISAEQQRIVDRELLEAIQQTDYIERFNLCLKKGANINATDWAGRTPLMLAVGRGQAARVSFVLTKNPDLFIKNNDNLNAFDLAKKINDSDNKKNVMDKLLAALPDGAPETVSQNFDRAAEPALPEAAEEDGGIKVSKPIRLNQKGPKTGGNGPNGGFRL